MTPIFIISFNRLEVLKKSINSYRKIEGSVIIIHDTGSTYGPLLDYLKELELQGIEVYWNRPCVKHGDDLNSVDDTIQNWLRKHRDVDYYVVTDPDIMLENGTEDILKFYEYLINRTGVSVIGPMLRIDDIPFHYPLRKRVIDGHTLQYWSKVPEKIIWDSKLIEFQHARIDTTFGMYSANAPFRRYNPGIRTYKPYWAKHLDWYIDPYNMTEDQAIYLQSASSVSHWGGEWLRKNLEHGFIPPINDAFTTKK